MIQAGTSSLGEWRNLLPALPAAVATILAAALTACATLFATALTLLVSRIKQRGDSTTRSLLIKEAKDRIAFWKQWYEAQQSADPSSDAEALRTKLKAELDAVAKDLRRGLVRPAKPNSLIRRGLLLYKPTYSLVWIPRIVFYYVAIQAFYILKPSSVASMFSGPLKQAADSIFKQHAGPPPEQITLGLVLGAINPPGLAIFALLMPYIFFVVFLVIATVLFDRWVAVDLDKDNLLGGEAGASLSTQFHALQASVSELLAKVRNRLERLT